MESEDGLFLYEIGKTPLTIYARAFRSVCEHRPFLFLCFLSRLLLSPLIILFVCTISPDSNSVSQSISRLWSPPDSALSPYVCLVVTHSARQTRLLRAPIKSCTGSPNFHLFPLKIDTFIQLGLVNWSKQSFPLINTFTPLYTCSKREYKDRNVRTRPQADEPYKKQSSLARKFIILRGFANP